MPASPGCPRTEPCGSLRALCPSRSQVTSTAAFAPCGGAGSRDGRGRVNGEGPELNLDRWRLGKYPVFMRLTGLVVVALALVVWAPALFGDTIFDTGIGNSFAVRGADSGVGEGVSVGVTTDLTQIGFYMAMPSGGDAKFMIWDGDIDGSSNLLYSQTISVSASSTVALVLSDPFSFTLNSGSTYYFGIIGDNELWVSYFYPTIEMTLNGPSLMSLVNPNSNYSDFNNPTIAGDGATTIALALIGGTSEIPEPGTFVLLGIGLGALYPLYRRKRARA